MFYQYIWLLTFHIRMVTLSTPGCKKPGTWKSLLGISLQVSATKLNPNLAPGGLQSFAFQLKSNNLPIPICLHT